MEKVIGQLISFFVSWVLGLLMLILIGKLAGGTVSLVGMHAKRTSFVVIMIAVAVYLQGPLVLIPMMFFLIIINGLEFITRLLYRKIRKPTLRFWALTAAIMAIGIALLVEYSDIGLYPSGSLLDNILIGAGYIFRSIIEIIIEGIVFIPFMIWGPLTLEGWWLLLAIVVCLYGIFWAAVKAYQHFPKSSSYAALFLVVASSIVWIQDDGEIGEAHTRLERDLRSIGLMDTYDVNSL